MRLADVRMASLLVIVAITTANQTLVAQQPRQIPPIATQFNLPRPDAGEDAERQPRQSRGLSEIAGGRSFNDKK
jgi:hypothetical protein